MLNGNNIFRKIQLRFLRQYFDGVIQITLIFFVGEDISIGCAMHNKCSQAISTEDDADEVYECETLHLLKLNNDLQLQVKRDR